MKIKESKNCLSCGATTIYYAEVVKPDEMASKILDALSKVVSASGIKYKDYDSLIYKIKRQRDDAEKWRRYVAGK